MARKTRKTTITICEESATIAEQLQQGYTVTGRAACADTIRWQLREWTTMTGNSIKMTRLSRLDVNGEELCEYTVPVVGHDQW